MYSRLYTGCIILRTVPMVCHSCLELLHKEIYSLLMRGFHGDSRPIKNSCRPSSRSISLEICYSHLNTRIQINDISTARVYMYVHIVKYMCMYIYKIALLQQTWPRLTDLQLSSELARGSRSTISEINDVWNRIRTISSGAHQLVEHSSHLIVRRHFPEDDVQPL